MRTSISCDIRAEYARHGLCAECATLSECKWINVMQRTLSEPITWSAAMSRVVQRPPGLKCNQRGDILRGFATQLTVETCAPIERIIGRQMCGVMQPRRT